MDYQKAIETLQDIHDVAEVRIKSGDTRGVVYIPSEKIKDIESVLSAMEELEHYKQLGTLEEVKEAVEKQKKVKVIKAYDSDVDSHWCSCGNCTKGLCWEHGIKINYCPECGQKLDWG